MLCPNCGKEIVKTYWQRSLPDVFLCHSCWALPDEISSQIIRNAVAHVLKDARKAGKYGVARAALKELRGTGVPPNPKRGKQ
jgi:hypothetical protein